MKKSFKRKLLYTGVLMAAGIGSPVQAANGNKLSCEPLAEHNIAEKDRVNKAALKQWQGKKIHKVEITIKNIFDESDPKENRWIYRLANDIQVNTRETTVRSQLLFQAGDKLDVNVIQDSLRRLYANEYLLDVKLRPIKQCGEQVILELVVRDAWTIEPRISAGHEGGESSSEIGVRDGNFLGSGAELELIYKKDAERSQIDYKYRSENFLGTRWLAEFYHADLSDGENNRVILEKPFYSNTSRWAYGFEVEKLTQVDKIRQGGELTNAYRHQLDNENIYLGHAFSVNAERTHRVNIGYTGELRTFSQVEATLETPLDEQQSFQWVELERQTNEFKTYNNLNFIKRAEDVAMGPEYSVRFGYGTWGDTEPMTRLIAEYRNATALAGNHLFEINSYVDAVNNHESASLANSTIGLSATYHHYVDGKNRWQVHASWDKGNKLAEHREFTLGEEVGMRGYPLSYQRGDNRYLVNIERRFYSNIHWFNLIRVGAVAFVDIGRAWHSDATQQADHLASTGVGLRLHSSKSGNPAVVHINASAPLVKNEEHTLDNYLLSVSVGSAF